MSRRALIITPAELDATHRWRGNDSVCKDCGDDLYVSPNRICPGALGEARNAERTEGDSILSAATRLLASLGEYVRQSMTLNPEWRDGVLAVETVVLERRRRLHAQGAPERRPDTAEEAIATIVVTAADIGRKLRAPRGTLHTVDRLFDEETSSPKWMDQHGQLTTCHLGRGWTWEQVTTSPLYVALMAGLPGPEVTGGGYARMAVTMWERGDNDDEVRVKVAFPEATSDWDRAEAFAVFDASTGGTRVCGNYFGCPAMVWTGGRGTFRLTIEERLLAPFILPLAARKTMGDAQA